MSFRLSGNCGRGFDSISRHSNKVNWQHGFMVRSEAVVAKRIELFSTHEDAVGLLGMVESDSSLCYVKVGSYFAPVCPSYTSAIHIPNLGSTSHPDRTSSDRYMIFPQPTDVVFREVIQNAGGKLYMVDPWKNPPLSSVYMRWHL